ncbi:MAG TPA: helix-turn-helix transcriptional regulator [Gemmatimonadales bacterium]|nr:helix-turn-helix transcriptional regulator [Gemmatimonadales bacterium]
MLVSMETQSPMATEFRLQELLEESGLSQRELAARAGVSPTTVNRMCTNRSDQVHLDTLDAISEVLSDVLSKRRGTPVRIEPGDLLTRVPGRKRRTPK